jgi:hypothetical protein
MNIEKILIPLIGMGYTYSISKFILDENTIYMNNKLKVIQQTKDTELIRKELLKYQEWSNKSVFYKIFIGPK